MLNWKFKFILKISFAQEDYQSMGALQRAQMFLEPICVPFMETIYVNKTTKGEYKCYITLGVLRGEEVESAASLNPDT